MMTTYDHKKKKKTQDYQRRNLVSLLISILITLVCWYGNFISKGRIEITIVIFIFVCILFLSYILYLTYGLIIESMAKDVSLFRIHMDSIIVCELLMIDLGLLLNLFTILMT